MLALFVFADLANQPMRSKRRDYGEPYIEIWDPEFGNWNARFEI
jgi:hypothetical protein